MYSDDDLQDENYALFYTWNGRPEMRAFELDEEQTRLSFAVSLRRTDSEGDEIDPVQITKAIEWIRLWRVQGFFKLVQGFYKADLDLSGRHASRLSDMMSRWNTYLCSFLDLSVHAREFEATVNFHGRKYTTIDYTFDNPGAWEHFRTTWKIPPMIDYGFILEETKQTLEIIAASSGILQVQELCLVDLPSEILDGVFSHASRDKARRLASTCRRLRELGHRHLVSAQRIILKRPLSFYSDLMDSGLPPEEYIATIATAAREDTLAFCDFLENRQDLLVSLDDLIVSDQWVDIFEQTVIQDHPISQLDGGQFYSPLHKSVGRILDLSVNLTVLHFNNMKLNHNHVTCICKLPKLYRLDLFMCRISKQARHALILDTRGALASSIRHLDIVVTNDKTPWYAMLFCQKLHSFSVRAYDSAVFPPPEGIWDKCCFFDTLKYLYLGRLALFHLQTFADWIQQSSHGNTSYLTHLKIEVGRGMSDASIISFLQAVRNAPLEALSIEGALQADLPLFDWIAQHFPHLLGLTIIRRSSTRSRRTRPVEWPLPTWQYAQCFSAFSKLQYFGWNNEKFLSTCSTCYSLRSLQEGGLDVEEDDGEEALENDQFWHEDLWTPKLFAIYCPTLRTFTLTFMLITYRISRSSEGVIKVENEPRSIRYNENWDPSSVFGHWPIVAPQDQI